MTIRQREIEHGLDGNEHIRLCYLCQSQFIAYLGQRKCNACYSGHSNHEYREEMENRISKICEEVEN